MRHSRKVFLVLGLLATGGCVSDGAQTVAEEGLASAPRPVHTPGASHDLEIGRRHLENEQFSIAIPRLIAAVEQGGTSPAGAQARYFLGLAYYRLGGYWEAREQFDRYLELAPEGAYAEQARQLLTSLDSTVDMRYETIEEAASDLATARARAQAAPDDLGAQLALADLLWRNHQYNEAGEAYASLVRRWPQLRRDATVLSRIEVREDGTVVVLSPDETQRRLAEREPLVVYNTAAFRSGRDTVYARSFQEIFYNVTGQVVNRGTQPLRNVQLIVTIYGFGSTVFDTQTITIGGLAPGAVRPFSARFTNFDNIENVTRYDVVPTYEY